MLRVDILYVVIINWFEEWLRHCAELPLVVCTSITNVPSLQSHEALQLGQLNRNWCSSRVCVRWYENGTTLFGYHQFSLWGIGASTIRSTNYRVLNLTREKMNEILEVRKGPLRNGYHSFRETWPKYKHQFDLLSEFVWNISHHKGVRTPR